MKRVIAIILVLMVVGCMAAGLSACASESEKERLITECQALRSEIVTLEAERDTLEQLVVDTKIKKGTATYVVKINIAQSHIAWDFENALKDSMNDVDINIPVSEEFYNSVEKGTVLNNSFRMGSFIMTGSVGSWDITVSDKWVE